ncbi:MAG: hypothetical protein JWN51_3123 [Phycisphaerales bacterium]|nr:hypothetical protein [Phycisphaerales bacterium]
MRKEAFRIWGRGGMGQLAGEVYFGADGSKLMANSCRTPLFIECSEHIEFIKFVMKSAF